MKLITDKNVGGDSDVMHRFPKKLYFCFDIQFNFEAEV
jgi:hypothetical protein